MKRNLVNLVRMEAEIHVADLTMSEMTLLVVVVVVTLVVVTTNHKCNRIHDRCTTTRP